MNCFYHPEKEAVAQCTECNKGLCNECATRFNKPICDSCARKVLKSQLSYYWTPLIVSVVLFVVVYIICSQQALSMHDTLSYSFGLVFLNIYPVSLECFSFDFYFVFQNTPIVNDGFCRGYIPALTCDENFVDS